MLAVQKQLGPDATVNSIIAALTAAKRQPVVSSAGMWTCAAAVLTSVSNAGPAPTLRNNVRWKLDYFL